MGIEANGHGQPAVPTPAPVPVLEQKYEPLGEPYGSPTIAWLALTAVVACVVVLGFFAAGVISVH